MIDLLSLIVCFGLMPGVAAAVLSRRRHADCVPATDWSLQSLTCSTLLCTLAFNLTFIWQEIWLVVPKALTPGLHPILYHNNHDWTGISPIVELLQGSGAVATAVSGVAACIALRFRTYSPGWRLFLFWLAFQGLNQSLSQLAVATLIPQNDVGRALTYLGVEGAARHATLLGVAVALGVSGFVLARLMPGRFAMGVITPGLISILCSIPFRVPRDPLEVILVPTLSTVIGLGWLLLGMAPLRRIDGGEPSAAALRTSAIALLALFAVFQFVLRPGMSF